MAPNMPLQAKGNSILSYPHKPCSQSPFFQAPLIRYSSSAHSHRPVPVVEPKPVSWRNYHTDEPLYADVGDITLRSKDGQIFKVRAIVLRVASKTFDSMLSADITVPSEIPIDHTGTELELFLRYIHKHQFTPFTRMTSTSTPLLIGTLMTMLDKYQCEEHLASMKEQARLICCEEVDTVEMFKLCCRYGWLEAGRQYIENFGKLGVAERRELVPERLERKYVEGMGLSGSRAYAKACQEGRKKGGEVDWSEASGEFNFDWE